MRAPPMTAGGARVATSRAFRGHMRTTSRHANRPVRTVSRNEDGCGGEVAAHFSRIVRRVIVLRRGAASKIRVQVLVQAAVPRAKGRQRTVLGIWRK